MIVYLETSIFVPLSGDNYMPTTSTFQLMIFLVTKVLNLRFSSYREIPQSDSGGRSVSDRFHPSGEAGAIVPHSVWRRALGSSHERTPPIHPTLNKTTTHHRTFIPSNFKMSSTNEYSLLCLENPLLGKLDTLDYCRDCRANQAIHRHPGHW